MEVLGISGTESLPLHLHSDVVEGRTSGPSGLILVLSRTPGV